MLEDIVKVKIKIKKLHPDAIIPNYAHPGDVGMDLYSVEDVAIAPGKRATISTGIAMEYPPGYCTLFWDKSGLASKNGITVLAGAVEYTYRGDYKVVLLNTSDSEYKVKKGDKIAQVLVMPIMTAEVEEVQELSESVRGANGFGSTGLSKK
jgi:dUTP pyrophosphatase